MKKLDDLLDAFIVDLHKRIREEKAVSDDIIEIVLGLFAEMEVFKHEAYDVLKGNKSAGKRARVSSMKLTHDLKEFRKKTVIFPTSGK